MDDEEIESLSCDINGTFNTHYVTCVMMCTLRCLATTEYKDTFIKWYNLEGRPAIPANHLYPSRCGPILKSHASKNWSFGVYGLCMRILAEFLDQEIVATEEDFLIVFFQSSISQMKNG
jgi:hypothetical protein